MARTRPTFTDRARNVVERFSFRNLTLAFGAAALLAGLAAAVTLRAPEQYEATTILVIDNPLALATSGDDGTVNKLDRLRGKYATLAATQAIAAPVAEELGVGPGAVIERTEVFASPSTLGLVVVGRGGTADGATSMADAMADGIVDYVEAEHEANAVPAEDRFTFTVVQPAQSARKSSPSNDRALDSAVLTFGFSLVAAYVILQLLRTPIVTPQPSAAEAPPGT
jgi:hypothetical protein